LLNGGHAPAASDIALRGAGIDEPTDRGAAVRSVALNRKMLSYAVALTLIAIAALVPVPAHGLTLGNVAAQSALGQPLRVVIPVDLGQDATLNSACIKLVANNSAVDVPQIVTGRVSLEGESTTSPRLVISTPAAFREPVARLSVQVGCGSTTRREYVLLFDPPALQSSTMLAVADGDDPSWTRIPRRSVEVAHNTAAAPAAPRSMWGTPVPTGAPATETPAPQRGIEEPKPEPAVAAVESAAVPRELVTLTASTGGGMFIQEAAAASLSARTITPRAITAAAAAPANPKVSAQSIPLANLGTQRARESSAVAAWQMAWPFAAGIFCTIALAIVGFVVHRRSLQEKSWLDPKARTSLKGETQAGNPQVTFAHFGAMTEAPDTKSRAALELRSAADRTVPLSELDTLLRDIQSDLIDERAIKEAYKDAAADAELDMGSDSILKAIAEAERDLEIGAPEPRQAALDNALDNDLMTIPNVPKGVRFG
jgi:hypothetical protein